MTDKPPVAERSSPARDEILELTRRHGVTYTPTALDKLGDAMTRLAGNDVQFDEAEGLLLALERAGHLPTAQANRLHLAYLRQVAAADRFLGTTRLVLA